MVRLQKFIADAGITSRRKAEDLITQGRVKVNGLRVTELGTKVNPSDDVVMVDGNPIDQSDINKVYVLLNKPRSVMTTVSDPEGRKTVMDFVGEVPERIYPVGRLDYLSEGLLLMTNDGELANQVIHPSSNIEKVYEVKVFGAISQGLLKKLRDGAQTDDGFLKPKAVRVIKQLAAKTWLEFRLTEGKNREIRKICEANGLTVDKLKRVAIGGLTVEGIRPGGMRYLSKKQLIDLVGLGEKPPVEYWSSKGTVNLKRKGHQDCSLADNEGFKKLRRDVYYDSLKEIKEKKERLKEEEKRLAFKEKEEAHQARLQKKRRRQAKKEEAKGHVHAQIDKKLLNNRK